MSSIQTSVEHAAELRVDYKDLVAGQLVIVIYGLPTPGDNAVTRDAHKRRGVAAGSRRSGGQGSDSSPLAEEAEAIRQATGYAPALLNTLLIAAWKGKELLASELIAATIEQASTRDARQAAALTDYAKSVLCNGLGHTRMRSSLLSAHARRTISASSAGRVSSWSRRVPEPASAHQQPKRCATSMRMHVPVRRVGARRSCSFGRTAERWQRVRDPYREAIARFERGRATVHLPRTQLVYGEWLRRGNRRVDAREQLRAGTPGVHGLAAEAFADRAQRELLATGERARERTDDTRDFLTPQEAQIARLARDGFSNPEIGAQLLISPRTVQYHLRKVFRKLDISSRNSWPRASSLLAPA